MVNNLFKKDFAMAKKDNYVLIKTKADFERESNNFMRMTYERAGGAKYALAPDFDVNIIWSKNITPHNIFYPDYISRLIEGTLETMKKEEAAEFFNKIMTSIRSCEGYYFSPENLKKRLVNTDENSVTLFLQAFYYSRDKFLKDKNDSGKFNKAVIPDNQVLFNIIGEAAMGTLEYNFSGRPFEDMKMIESVLPKEKDEWRMTANQKKLIEKFNRDFNVVDVKKLFPGAKDPQGLYDLRRGKIRGWRPFLEKLDRDDFKFIRPAQDFADTDVRNLYDLMSMPGLRWNEVQVRAIMNMIIDKADASYFEEIIKVINTNKHIFLTQTEDNLKLWVKIENKFANEIKKSKDYASGVKAALDKAKTNIEENGKSYKDVKAKVDYLDGEKNLMEAVVAKAEKLKNLPDNNGFFAKQAKLVINAVNSFAEDGSVCEIPIPDKPWKLFAFDKEKKLYEQLLDAINSYNALVKGATDRRAELFGDIKFSHYTKRNELIDILRTLQRQTYQSDAEIKRYAGWRESDAAGIIAQENIDMQKAAKQKRFDAAKKKMQEKGIVRGQKSGVVRADEIAKQTRINNKVAQLRTKKAYADMPDEQLQMIATNIVFGKKR